MRLIPVAPLVLTAANVGAFAPPSSLGKARSRGEGRPRARDAPPAMMSTAPGGPADGGAAAPPPPRVQKKVLTAADVMAKSASSGKGGGGDPNAPGEQEAPKLFTPAIYDDFQSSLLLLEKRAKDGRGSLSREEVERFAEETGRIAKEMREFMADPEGVGEFIRKCYEGDGAAQAAGKGGTVVADAVKEPAASIPPKASTTVEATATLPSPMTMSNPPSVDEHTPSEDSVNFGLAHGTTNTYAIPGMDEMSAEEYRAKLQETISARQAQRRKVSLNAGKGIIGNKSSNGYLDGLSRGGENQGENNSVAGGEKSFGDRLERAESKAGVGDPSLDGAGPSLPRQQQPKQNQQQIQFHEKKKIDKENIHKVQNSKEGSSDKEEKTMMTSSLVDSSNNESSNKNNSEMPEASIQTSPESDDKRKSEEQRSRDVKARIAKEAKRAAWLEEQNQLVKERLEARRVAEKEVALELGRSPLRPSPQHPQGEAKEQGRDRDDKSNPGTLDNATKEQDAKQDESPILVMKQSKLNEERSRKLEWQGYQGAEIVPSAVVTKESGGRFKRKLQTDQDLMQASLEEETISSSPASTITDEASTNEDWWGDQRHLQRPVPTSERKASYFQVHHPSLGDNRAPQALQRVSAESTRSFVHGDEENSQRPTASAAGNVPGYFQVHAVDDSRNIDNLEGARRSISAERKVADHRGPGDIKSPDKRSPVSTSSAAKSLVGAEQRQRPFPSTDQHEYTTIASDHRAVGDTRRNPSDKTQRQSSSSAMEETTAKSLVQTEERIRPFPSVNRPEYATADDHRSVGDIRNPGVRSKQQRAPGSLVQSEERIRPVPSSNTPEYIQIEDRRSVGDVKDPKRQQNISSVAKSLIEKEERVRPVASTIDKPDRIHVGDHRGPGDDNTLTKKLQQSSATSLIEKEERVRPVASTISNPDRIQVGDHRGPGDDNTLTKKLHQSSATSLIEQEESVRPVSSALHQTNHLQVGDHRGPGDDNTLTKRLQQSSGNGAAFVSLSESEQAVRPNPLSNKYQLSQVGDYRGVGDTNSLTKRLKSSSPITTGGSSSDAELRIRPAPTSNQFENFQVDDFRGPGDSNTLTKKLQYKKSSESSPDASIAASLSEEEQRVRPAPTSDQFQPLQVSDRGPGDTRTLTKKAMSSSSSAAVALSSEGVRQRPVPSGSSNSAGVLDRAMDESQKQAAKSSTPSKESAIAPPRRGLTSLLIDDARHASQSGRSNRDKNTDPMRPVAVMTPSALQSLVKDEWPIEGVERNTNIAPHGGPPSKTSQLSSLLNKNPARSQKKQSKQGSSSTYEIEWWNERPKRPPGYVKHSQPMNSSYVKKFEPPRDWGDVVTALQTSDNRDDDEKNAFDGVGENDGNVVPDFELPADDKIQEGK